MIQSVVNKFYLNIITMQNNSKQQQNSSHTPSSFPLLAIDANNSKTGHKTSPINNENMVQKQQGKQKGKTKRKDKNKRSSHNISKSSMKNRNDQEQNYNQEFMRTKQKIKRQEPHGHDEQEQNEDNLASSSIYYIQSQETEQMQQISLMPYREMKQQYEAHEKCRKISEQAAKYELLHIQQIATPNRTKKNSKSSQQHKSTLLLHYQQPYTKSNLPKNRCKKRKQSINLNHQRIHSNSLKQINNENKIIETSSDSNLKTSPPRKQIYERYEKGKRVSNFDILKLHAEKLQKSNILISSNVKERKQNLDLKINIEQPKYRGDKQDSGFLYNKLDRLEINLLNKAKIENGFKGSALISIGNNNKMYGKYRKKSQMIYQSRQGHKNMNETSIQIGHKNSYAQNLSNRNKTKYKNTHSSFTNRSSVHRKNKSVSSNMYTKDVKDKESGNNEDEEQGVDGSMGNFRNEKLRQSQPRCQEIIKIQDEEQHEKQRPNTGSHNRYRRVSTEPDQPLKRYVHNQYIISNQFWPMASRSILDKNRKNIKKINNIYNKIKTNIKDIISNKVQQSDVNITANGNIDEFIRTKFNLLQNNEIEMHLYDEKKEDKNTKKKSIMTCVSFYEKTYIKNQDNQQTNLRTSMKESTSRNKLKIKHENSENEQKSKQFVYNQPSVSKQTASESFLVARNSNSKSQPKSYSITANRFYKPLVQKCKDKANLLISDPYLKTKAIDISRKQNKKSEEIVIICL